MKRILIQLDTDERPSSFDRVVAIDSDVDELFSYGGITPENVVPLVHGAIFTRGPKSLKNTAIWIGGSNVSAGEAVLKKVKQSFFGPMRVSVMMDSNGSNTTAAAAVLAVQKHQTLDGCEVIVLGGTGPVGQRAAQLLAGRGARVLVVSRSLDRAQATCDAIGQVVETGELVPVSAANAAEIKALAANSSAIMSAGAAGVEFMGTDDWNSLSHLKVAIDLNAVPPVGLAGIDLMDAAKERSGIICYGAIGVGGAKMKIHKAAVRALFETNDAELDTETIFSIGESL